MNLPSTKKLIAVLTNPQFQVRTLTVAICLLAAAPVFTQAGGDPWTRAVQVLQQTFTTTIARGLALVAIVVGGLGFAHGEGGSKRPLAGIIFGSGMAVLSSFVTHLEWYSGLFARLNQFNFVCIGTEQRNFATAEAEFTKGVRTTPPNAIHKLIRHFQPRELEDTKQYSKIVSPTSSSWPKRRRHLLESPSTRSTTAGKRTKSGTPKSVRSLTTTTAESTSTSPRFCLPNPRCTSSTTPGSTARGA